MSNNFANRKVHLKTDQICSRKASISDFCSEMVLLSNITAIQSLKQKSDAKIKQVSHEHLGERKVQENWKFSQWEFS